MILITVFLSVLLVLPIHEMEVKREGFNKLYPILEEYVKRFPVEFRKIPEDRRYRLNEVVYYLEEQIKNNEPSQLLFIDTSQIGVSQLMQVWSKTAAYYFGFTNFESFSGGISPNEIEEKTITSMEKAGFIAYKSKVDRLEVYRIKYSYNLQPIVAFPKKVDHVKNPYEDFMAITVDENTEINLPKIKGTYHRLFLNYEMSHGNQESDIGVVSYENMCQKVAVEMFYVFAQLRKRTRDN